MTNMRGAKRRVDGKGQEVTSLLQMEHLMRYSFKRLYFNPLTRTFFDMLQPNDAVCDLHLHEAPGGEGEGASWPRT